jgi:hypothetical protein
MAEQTNKDTAAFGAKTITRQALVKGDRLADGREGIWEYYITNGATYVRWSGPTGLRQWLKDWDKRAQAKAGGLGKQKRAEK